MGDEHIELSGRLGIMTSLGQAQAFAGLCDHLGGRLEQLQGFGYRGVGGSHLDLDGKLQLIQKMTGLLLP